MTIERVYTTMQLHKLFQQYLLEKFEGDHSEANVIVDTAE